MTKSLLLLAAFVLLTPKASGFVMPFFSNATAGVNSCKSLNGTTSDIDNASTGFGGGTLSNLRWDGTKLVLNNGQTSGTFTSRIFDSRACLKYTPWTGFNFRSSIPFYKALPNTSEAAAAYPAIEPNMMSNIVGLWHLDEASYNGTANEVVDSSGNARHGRATGVIPSTTGLFNRAADMTIWNDQSLVFSNLPVASEVFTFQIWFKGTTIEDYPAIVMRYDNATETFGWMLQNDPSGYTYLRIDTSADTNNATCNSNSAVAFDGKWHQIVISLNNGECRYYFDGELTSIGSYTRGTGLTAASNLQISDNALTAHDEVALWSRVLSGDEIRQLYRRGANRLKLQVRTCTSATCADAPAWRGPDGTASTYFTELNNNSNPVTGLGSVLTNFASFLATSFPSLTLPNRYFQYRVLFESETANTSPDLISVGVSGVTSDASKPQTTVVLTSGTSWTVPSDWNNSNNSIACIGGGGAGAAGVSTGRGGGGGGGGAYAASTNVALTPGSTVTYAIGAGGATGAGGASWFCNSTSNCTAVTATAVVVGARGGSGSTTAAGAAGGAATGVGSTQYAGGTGGSDAGSWGGGGGGGAAGPNGAGRNGGASAATGNGGGGGGGSGGGTNGVSASGDFGGAGGANFAGRGAGRGGDTYDMETGVQGFDGGGGGGGAYDHAGAHGGNGSDLAIKIGSGGGGGGAGWGDPTAQAAGNGGLYGAGGGGAAAINGARGVGAQGVCVIKYTP